MHGAGKVEERRRRRSPEGEGKRNGGREGAEGEGDQHQLVWVAGGRERVLLPPLSQDTAVGTPEVGWVSKRNFGARL